ncbi:MAG: hypothetical protein ACOYD6_04290 [Limnochordia bacterium]|jgi:hypothetical protein
MKSRKTALIILILMAILFSGCGGGTGTRISPDRSDLVAAEKQVRKFFEAMMSLDAAAMGEVVAPMIELTGTDALGKSMYEKLTREEFVTEFQSIFDNFGIGDQPMPSLKLTSRSIGTRIIVTAVTSSENGNGEVVAAVFTLEKINRTWLISEWYFPRPRGDQELMCLKWRKSIALC